MKKVITILIFCIFVWNDMRAQTGPPACSDFVTIKGNYFQCGGELFYPLGVCYNFAVYHPATTSEPTDTASFILGRDFQMGAPTVINGDTLSVNNCSCMAASNLASIRNDFVVIRKMGFNTIRTTQPGVTFDYRCATCITEPQDSVSNSMVVYAFGCLEPIHQTWGSNYCMIITNNANDHYRLRMFHFIRDILQAAHDAGIKVILDIGYQYIADDDNVDTYETYLGLLASYVHNNLPVDLQQTLMAYNILEEPGYEMTGSFTKGKVCTRISEMYDILKQYDPDHLVSVGGCDIYDVSGWDPGVMKLDYWSPHLYIYPHDYEVNSDAAVERVRGQLYWLKNNCPLPWLIGESSFGATDDEIAMDTVVDDSTGQVYPGWKSGRLHYPLVNGELGTPVNGETYTQKSFADTIVKAIRDYGGCGFTWYGWQEGWGANPRWNPDVNGNNLALLRHGNTDSAEYEALLKPAAAAFENYLDGQGQPPAIDPNGAAVPASYDNPYNHSAASNAGCLPNRYHHVSGTVKDANNQAIKDAFVYGSVSLGFNDSTKKNEHELIYTYTNATGEFVLDAYNYRPQNDNNLWYFQELYLSASGADKGGAFYNNVPSSFNSAISVSDLRVNDAINNLTLQPGSVVNYKALNALEVNNVIIKNGAVTDFVARSEVNVHSEFHAKNGSSTHIYCAPIFPECTDFVNYKSLLQNPGASTLPALFKSDEIELRFQKTVDPKTITVSPNPGKGIYEVRLNSGDDRAMKAIKVFNITGQSIFYADANSRLYVLDLSEQPPGIYYLQVFDNDTCYSSKLIKQ